MLYEIDGARHDRHRALARRLEDGPLSPSIEAFASRIIDGVIESRDEIDSIISTYAPAWPISQMAVVDRNLLRVAIFEMVFGGATPPKVAINEAVELGKVFGSDASPGFVNGVLGSVMDSGMVDGEGDAAS